MIREDDPLWRRWRLAAIALLSAALFLPSVWTRDLWDPDEPRYAEATRQMQESGDLLVPRFNGEIYSEKPPLFFWLSLAAEKIPGVPPGSGGRLVGVLASAGTLLLTWRIGALLMGEATGALAAALLSACILFWDLAQSGVIDPLLAFCVTGSIYGYARHVRGRRPGMAIFYLAAAAGVLAKGPVGLIVPALAAMTHAILAGGGRALRARHPLWGIPLVLAPVTAWLLLASARAGTGYFETMVFKQNVGRAVNAYVHREAWWYYFEVGPFVLMPLTLFLPQALVTAWREKIHGIRPILLPLAWFGSTALFFTVVSSKKTRYLLALAPAAALLVAGWFMRRYLTAEGKIRQGRALLCIAACGALAIATLLALPAM
ncbi:MAG TPA: glycosyltransferase family 39 protein, partial [Candidatus Saccharimonadales bacterium]|nr:glycosyltransferase family 39 protein [Candidatus Saccharimonadales bacterium]